MGPCSGQAQPKLEAVQMDDEKQSDQLPSVPCDEPRHSRTETAPSA